MTYEERGLVFECQGESLLGVASVPREVRDVGVVIIVGGPQYRVGSHRQFVLIARQLASRGIACFRFDNRGMGDSTGPFRDFEIIEDDVGAAVDAFLAAVPQVRRVVLWGLCGGASAACLYAPRDPRVAGTFLVNPWVRTDESEAKTYLKHYYGQRLLEPAFWRKLLSGRVGVRSAASGFFAILRKAGGGARDGEARKGGRSVRPKTLLDRMLAGLEKSACRSYLLLSGRDYVGRECEEFMLPRPEFAALEARGLMSVRQVAAADHTFASRDMHRLLETATVQWVESFDAQPHEAGLDLARA